MNREQAIARLKAQEGELRNAGVLTLYLFGSTARGDNRPDSDIDLVCEIDQNRRLGLIEFVGIKQRLEGLLAGPVDLIEREALRPRIRRNAEAEMVRIF